MSLKIKRDNTKGGLLWENTELRSVTVSLSEGGRAGGKV